ncbi:unnamed protein product [Prorocentrum cordatum]|uniref:Uncharacterized protein n=1 Tax=Prorocentrum cordatum TaxID=2364126 RepID=A0ABN9UCU2_9DINO|nr:unnamed protein product [Polarella glacialis]
MAALPAAAQRGGAPSSGEEIPRVCRRRVRRPGASSPGGRPATSSGTTGASWSFGRRIRTGRHGRHPGGHLQTPAHLHYEQLDRQRPRGPELAGPSEAPHLRLRTLRAEASGRESRGCTPTRSSTLAAPAGANGCWSTTGGGLLGPPSPSRASRGKSTTASSSASALAAHRQERCGF